MIISLKKYTLATIFFVAMLMLSLDAYADDADTFVTKVTLGENEVAPASIATIPVRIEGEPGATLSLSYDVPEEWRILSFDRSVTLREDGTYLTLITLDVPQNAASGDHSISLTARADGSQSTMTNVVTVIEQTELIVETQSVGTHGVVGEPFYDLLQLRNASNVELDISLSVASRFGETTFEERDFTIAPGDLKEVQAETLVEHLETQRTHSFRVFVEVLNRPELSRTVSFVRSVLPRAEDGRLVYHSFPLEFRTTGVWQRRGDRTDTYGQVSISGRGTLDEDSETEMEIDLSVPDAPSGSAPFFPVYDRYFLGFFNPEYEYQFGDHNLQRTRLTGASDYGFGISGLYRFGSEGEWDVSAGFVERRTRRTGGGFFEGSSRGASSRVGYTWNENTYTSLNYGWRQNFFSGQAFSLYQTVGITNELNVEGEISRDLNEGEHGTSWMVRPTYNDGRLSVSAYAEEFSDQSIGFSRGSWGVGSDVGYRITDRFSIGQSVSKHENTLFSNIQTLRSRSSVSYSPFSVFYEYTERDGTSITDSQEDAVGGSVSHSYGDFRATASLRVGWVDFEGINQRLRNERYRGSLTYRPHRDFSVRGSITHRSGVSSYSPRQRNTTSYMLDARWQVVPSTRATAQASWTYYNQVGTTVSYDRYRAGVQHTLPWNHQVSVEGIYRNGGSFSGEGVMVEYIMPINVPIHRSRHSGAIRGVVVNQNEDVIVGVPVSTSQGASITDETGEFYIGQLPVGTHNVEIDREALGYDMIVTNRDELRSVEVEGAKQTDIVINVVESSRLTGTVLDENGRGVQGVVIDLELEDGERLRRVTRSNGTFSFSRVTPGEGTLSINERFSDVEVVSGQQEVSLIAGETGEVDFDVRVEDEIQVIREESIRLSNNGSLSSDAQEMVDSDNYELYIVRSGDWLSKIAREEYGDFMKWPTIYDRNADEIEDPDLIYPGQEIIIPVIQ